MDTNLFLNSYKKKEDELTYAFLSLIETVNSKLLFEYLAQKKLVNNPLKSIKVLPTGNNTNPDGELIMTDDNNKEFKLYFENKTKIRPLDKEQLKGHLSLCSKNDKLLVITPRKHDKSIINEINDNRIIFFTWPEIATELINLVPENKIIEQFIEYGNISGQFEELGEITNDDITNEIEKWKVKFDDKMDTILRYLLDKFKTEKYPFSSKNIECNKPNWGRWGIEIYGKRKTKTYGQWIFIGYYYNTDDHRINFIKDGVPEIAIFFDIDENKFDKILEDIEFCDKIKKLKKYSFENNFDCKKTKNKYRLFFRRKSLDDFDKINAFILNDFIHETFEIINTNGLGAHKYFTELM